MVWMYRYDHPHRSGSVSERHLEERRVQPSYDQLDGSSWLRVSNLVLS